MMYWKEKKARTLWCPFAKREEKCLGWGCMAWAPSFDFMDGNEEVGENTGYCVRLNNLAQVDFPSVAAEPNHE